VHDEFRQALKKLGLKATPRRLALLQTLADSSIYLSAEEVWVKLKEDSRGVGLPTVYRNLEELAEGGLLSKVLHPDRKLYYYLCGNRAHHHHFVCVSCRKVEDIGACALEAISREIGETVRGKVLSHTFQVEGLCENCCNAQGAKKQ
jgi:Fe2+ or Zn2+ uptake regulation protein